MAPTNLGEGRKLVAGNFFSTRQIALAADTYHIGMLLEYQATGTAVTTGTGNGVASDIVADGNVALGVYTCTFTAALVCDLSDPDGNVIATGLTVPDGSAATFKINGLTFTLTDGGTAWVATDTIAMTVVVGAYLALDEGNLSAIYNGSKARVLASAGEDNCIVAGEISASGIVDDSGDALTLTDAQVAAFALRGFWIKEN